MKIVYIIKLFLITILIGVINNPINIQAEENQDVVANIELNYDYIPKNGSNAHNLTWGSDIGISAKVLYSDGMVASNEDSKVTWTVSSVLNNTVQVATTEYVNLDGQESLEIYAPYNYCDELVITACLANNTDIQATYQLKVIDGTEWNGTNFFKFLANEPKGTDVSGKAPKVKETWDVKEKAYSVVLPENLYKVKGYRFRYWEDNLGKQYKPGETLTVSVKDVSYYSLKAAWKVEQIKKVEETPKVTESTVSKGKSKKQNTEAPKTGDVSGETRIWCVAAVVSVIGIYVCYKGRNKSN